MWGDLKIKVKVPAAILGFALLVGAGVGAASWWRAADAVRDLSREALAGVAADRRDALARYLDAIEQDLRVVAASPLTAEALDAFASGFAAAPGNATDALKRGYIRENPNPIGRKHDLDRATTVAAYDDAHAAYHPWFRKLLTERGYYDIFLFDRSGNLVYTVFKEEDFATNFAAGGGEWAHTALGEAYRGARAAAPGAVRFLDFAPYAPSADAPASFVATPIVRGGETIGVLAFQMPIDAINAVMGSPVGLGETGETVIVGVDGLLRNDSRFTQGNDILSARLDSPAVAAALAGREASAEHASHRGTAALQVAAPLSFHGAAWAVVAVKDVAEIDAPVAALRDSMLLTALALFGVAAVGGALVARTLTGPIERLTGAMTDLAAGRLQVALEEGRGDEIGAMSRAVAVFRENAVARARLEQEAQRERDRERQRQSQLEALIARFREVVSRTLGSVNGGTAAMRETAEALSRAADTAVGEAQSARAASTTASSEVQSVAAASEELAASIREIAMQAQRASGVVGRATEIAGRTNVEVESLSHTAERIGVVVDMIRSIAEQTNLLALNATIEAARAGPAGKGFAVVAAEVKSLAGQTAKATAEIADQIGAVQGSTRASVAAIREIGGAVREIESFMQAIAAAVEEQDAATKEISQSISLASNGSGQATRNVETVATAIHETSSEAGRVLDVSEDLSVAARELSGAVEDFLVGVSADVEDRRRAARARVDAAAAVLANGRRVPIRLIDLSETGARIAPVDGMAVGDRVAIELPSGVVVEAQAVRVGAAECGLRFREPLAPSALAA